MHPIEHLRYVARASGADPMSVAREAAAALAQMAVVEPAGLVPACRRLIERHLTAGPVWWMSARVLGGADPARAARDAGTELDDDPTDRELARALADDLTVLAVGWPEVIAGALRRRGDLEVLLVDSEGDGAALARRLDDGDPDRGPAIVPDAGIGAAAAVSQTVLVEAVAAGPTGLLATTGSHAAAAVAACAGVPVWGVTGVGRVLPGRLWEALLSRLDNTGLEPWSRPVEMVPESLLTGVVGPQGLVDVLDGLAAATCPVAPELLRPAG
jgi:hypothetical protein